MEPKLIDFRAEIKPPVLSRWSWNARTRLLEHEQRDYYVDFNRMNSSAQCLDWVFQLFNKTWTDAQDMYELLQAIQYYIQPQSSLCSGGIEMNLTAQS